MRHGILVLLLIIPLTATAQESGSSGSLFMKDLIGEREFFEPWGIGVDFYTMDQDYGIKELQFLLPGVGDIDSSLIGVRNELQHYDIKLDAWVTPFLNVFGLIGRLNADTTVDLSKVSIPAIPVPLGKLPISYDGTVYGLGFTLAAGGERWFTSVTSTWTDTNVSGDFNSSVSSLTVQPRVGLIRDKWNFWVGGMYLDSDEKHSGTINLIPGFPPIPFSVELQTTTHWNYGVGAMYVFSPKATVSLELGFGDRDHTLFNFTYRF